MQLRMAGGHGREDRERLERGPTRRAGREQVIGGEGTVVAGGGRPGRRRQRTPRIGREHRQAEPQLHPATASSARSAAPIAPASLPSDAGTIGTSGRTSAPSRECDERGAERREQDLTRLARASPDHDDLRIKDVHEPCDALAEPPPHLGEDPDRHGVVRAGRLGDELAGHPSGVAVRELRDRAVRVVLDRATARARDRQAARHLLPAAAVPAPAQGPVRLDDHVADLTGQTVCPTDEPSPRRRSRRRSPCPRPRTASRRDPRMRPGDSRPRGGGRVVVHGHGHAERGPHVLRERQVAPDQVRRHQQDAGRGRRRGRPSRSRSRRRRRRSPRRPPPRSRGAPRPGPMPASGTPRPSRPIPPT